MKKTCLKHFEKKKKTCLKLDKKYQMEKICLKRDKLTIFYV